MYAPVVFVDESKARGYLLAAAVMAPADLSWMRKHLNTLRHPGQRRLHFTTESESRRKAILCGLTDMGVTAVMYDASAYCEEKAARRAAMSRMVDDVVGMNSTLLVIERDDSLVATDCRTIRDRLIRAGYEDTLRYEHLRAHEECLLAIPDAIAWCWARGGEWRRRVLPLVTDVIMMRPTERPGASGHTHASLISPRAPASARATLDTSQPKP
jgi:hypothetical protein